MIIFLIIDELKAARIKSMIPKNKSIIEMIIPTRARGDFLPFTFLDAIPEIMDAMASGTDRGAAQRKTKLRSAHTIDAMASGSGGNF